ncbi:MAG TPA: OpgC domain-containing protein, partial [Anaerolineae bacterium]|nr:OpgC domain-containing protein [Anaerolineae bacterium]
SGLVAGLVYGRLVRRDGMARSITKMLTRAFKLYLLTLALTLAFLPLSELLGLPWAQGVDVRNPLALIVSILTLHRTYYLVDVMLLYTILFLLAPLAMALIDQGKRWWVLGASWLLWGVFQLWPEHAALPWPIAGNYLFSFSAWQVVFFTALAFSYGRAALPVPRPRTARRLLALSGAVLLGMIALFFAVEQPAATPLPVNAGVRALVEELFLDKVAVRPGRLLATGVTFTFLFLTATVFWRPVRRALGWLLLPLGQEALYAYTAHVALVTLAAFVPVALGLSGPSPWWLNALIQMASMVLIWVLVRYRVLAPTPRTQPLYNLSPALFAGLAALILVLLPSPAYPRAIADTSAAAERRANRFGTPLPPDAGKPTPAVPEATAARPTPAPSELQAVATAIPAPTPTPRETQPADPAQALERVAEWIGPLSGTLEEHWFDSGALGFSMPYWAYLPPDYGSSDRRYPVLYMLHGAGAHRDEWLSFGLVDVADREISAGALPPMIIILPQGDQSFWINNVGGLRWGDYVTQDLVAHIDATWSTMPEPQARALGGLSMGGYGALVLGFTHPEAFGVIGAHTPCLHSEGPGVALLGTGDEYAQRDPITLASTLAGLDQLRIWIDVGEQDPWLGRVEHLHDILADRGIGHDWQALPGTHIGEYWSTHVIDYLHFYGSALAQPHQTPS